MHREEKTILTLLVLTSPPAVLIRERNKLAQTVQAASRHDHVDVEMRKEFLRPGMQHGNNAWRCAKVLTIRAHLKDSLGGALKQLSQQTFLICEDQIIEGMGHCQNNVVIRNIRNDLIFPLLNPGLLGWILATGAVTVVAGSIVKIQRLAFRAI